MHRSTRWLLLLVALALAGWVMPGTAAVPAAPALPAPALSAPLSSHHAAFYPPYDPAKNYCGPEYLQEAGWGWVVPRHPIPGYDFSPACYKHDACYTECCQNGMSQAACDAQFLTNMTDICRDTTLDAFSWAWWPGKVCFAFDVFCYTASSVYASCLGMANTYTAAVSYLGDGVIETQPLALLLAPLGPVAVGAAFAIATFAGDAEIEAAYPCPCACLTCPPDEPLEEPVCVAVPPPTGTVSQDVRRYEKQGSNVSGLGPVCECVPSEVRVITHCPAGVGCDPSLRVCASDVCTPMTCGQTGIRGRCEEHGFSIGDVLLPVYATLITEWTWSSCEDVDEYRSECVTHAVQIGEVSCPGGCAPDGRSCMFPPLGTVRLQVSEPTTYHATTYVPCRGCRLQLEGAVGTLEGVTDGNGNLTMPGVPAGLYRVQYGCGRWGLGPHLPSDLATQSEPPHFWYPVYIPSMSPATSIPHIIAPTPQPVVTFAGRCGRPTCSAVELSPVPTYQDLPEAVAATRQQIIEAAVDCNYDALAELASSPYFHYAPGQSGDPVGYWRSQEEGPMGLPLLSLVETLNLPFGVVEPEGDVQYLWPAEWAEDYEFTGYRVVIHYTGEWLAYLEGEW